MPQRIQRQRRAGWRMPPNTVYVGRPTKWGNPFVPADLGETHSHHAAVLDCVRSFRAAVERNDGDYIDFDIADLKQLRGKNLACWCPLDQPCHADVLLELANRDLNTEAQ